MGCSRSIREPFLRTAANSIKPVCTVRIFRRGAGADSDQQLFEAIKPNLIGGEGEFPSLPLHLPEADRIAGSEKYIIGPAALSRLKNFSGLKDAIGFGSGAEVTTADYRSGGGQMNLIIVEYYTPQSASDGQARIQDHFNALPQPEKDRLILKRIGNYVAAMSNIQDMPAAQNIVGQIKYEKKIYWAGRKFTDIPLDFPPARSACGRRRYQNSQSSDPLLLLDGHHDTKRAMFRAGRRSLALSMEAVSSPQTRIGRLVQRRGGNSKPQAG